MAAGGFLTSTKGGFASAPGGGGGGGGVDHDAAITINDSGADADFRVESDDKTHMLVVDGGTNRVGIGLTGAPAAVLDIATGSTGNALCILVQEDASNKQSIIFREAGYSNFSLQYDGTGSAPANLFKVRAANGSDGVIDVDALTVSQVGNIGIGSSTFDGSAVGTLAVGNGTAPAAATANQCSIYAKDTSACVLLLNMDGSDDGTTFTDSSPSNHTMVVNNQAHTDTSIKKFGTASYQGDGVSDNITTPTSTDWAFGTGDFSVECFIYPLDVASYQMFIGHYLPLADWEFRLNSVGNKVEFVYSGTTFLAHTTTIAINTWYHMAYSRVNNVGNIFVNGVGAAGHTNNVNYVKDQPVAIGSRPGGTYSFNGHIDGVRIMKGEGLYVEDFTPPAVEMGGDSSELYVLDENGNESNISPHNVRSEWEFYSKNKNTGRCVRVNMERMIKRLEELHPGEKFLEEWTE